MMKGRTCLFSPAAALGRVFLPAPAQKRVDFASFSSSGSSSSKSYGSLLLIPRFLAPRGAPAAPLSPTRHHISQLHHRRYVHQRPPIVRHTPTGAATGGGKSGPFTRGPPGGPRPPGAHRPSGTPRPANPAAFRRPPVHRVVGNNNQRTRRHNDDVSEDGTAAAEGSSRGGGGGQRKQQYKLGRFPRDDEIPHRQVILRQDDGTLSEPQPTSAVLARLDRRTQSLVVVALPSGGGGGEKRSAAAEDEEGGGGGDDAAAKSRTTGGGHPRFPICKVVDKVAERRAEADKAREQRKKAVSLKELELNWAIDRHDLGHRLGKLREFLDKGMRVEVRLVSKGKKGKRKATRDEAAAVLQTVREAVAEVPGARESKPSEGELLRTVRLFLEGPAKKE